MKSHAQPIKYRNGNIRAINRELPLRPIALGVMLALCEVASANPTGPKVVAGAAGFQTSGTTLSVTNSPGTIINWGAFSIGGGETTRFLQQSAASAVLNRVVGSDGSSILGTLSSNGRVFLVNPNGVIFGPGARIDTAAFIASTLNITDSDFLQGRLKFEGGGNGVLRNEGTIRASGDIMLVGPRIENAGLIRSDDGSVLLAAGQKLTITSPDAQGVKFEVQAPSDSALNVGAIQAGNAAGMFAGTLRHSGEINVTTVTGEGGHVALVAQKGATIEKASTISASGLSGGSVTVQSGDTTLVSGRVDAFGAAERGGTVHVLGNKVGILEGASINASGETGGGTILVGGDFQGKNSDVQNAWRTFVGPNTLLRADAITAGNGGRIIVWADDITRYYGSVSARGGGLSGDGGFVEVSGKRYLDFNGHVDTRAPFGHAGTLVLDPTTINFVTADTATPDTPLGENVFQDASNDESEITYGALVTALGANNVLVTTNSPGGGAGDINFTGPFNFDGFAAARTLTLVANGNINISNPIFDAIPGGETLNLVLNAGGATNITAGISLGGGFIDATPGSKIVNFGGGTPTITNVSAFNAGTLNVTGGSAAIDSPTLVQENLNIAGGSVSFNSASTVGSLQLSSGTLAGTGALNVMNGSSFAGGTLASIGGVTVSGDVQFTASATQLMGLLTSTQGFSMSGGSSLSIASGGVLSLAPTTGSVSGASITNAGLITQAAGNLVLSNSSLTNSGVIDLTGSAVLQVGNGDAALLQNDSVLNLGGSARVVVAGGTLNNAPGGLIIDASSSVAPIALLAPTSGGSFVNAGAFNKDGGSGASQLIDVPFSNTGAVNVNSGTLALSSFPANSGMITVASSTALSTNSNDLVNTGTVTGAGTIDLGGATLANDGLVAPGAPTGTLILNGNYTQTSSGTLAVEIGGPNQGIDSALLQITGSANLGGTLNVTHLDGFAPPSDSSYTIMTFGSATGDFATKNFPAGYNYTSTLTPFGDPTSYVLGLGAVVNAWTAGSGAWEVSQNWSLLHVPTAGEDALIGDVGALGVSDTITVAAGDQRARKVTSFENLTVAAGGNLTLGTLPSTINAALTVSGGALTAEGSLAANAINLTSGTLTVNSGSLPGLNMSGGLLTRSTPGDLTITGPFDVTGAGSIVLSGEFITSGATTVTATVNPISNWRNTGVLDLNGAGQISASPGGLSFTNQGTVNLNTTDPNPFSNAGDTQIVNSGVMNKLSAVAADFANPFVNTSTGTLNVNSGTLTLPQTPSQAGTIVIAPGATLATGGNDLTNSAGALIGGHGTLNLGGATLTNNGTLQPGGQAGAPIGNLTIAGNLTQGATGVIDLQLAGTAPGAFDTLSVSVSGSALLAGTLNVTNIGGYVPGAGDTFTVLNAGAVAGSFDAITKSFANTINPAVGVTTVSLSIDSPPLNFWAFDGSDNWDNPLRWSLGHVPLATEQVKIDRPGVLTITVPAGLFLADRLQSEENVTLNGILGLANASIVKGRLAINGGTLQGSGPVTVSGMLALNAGTLAGPGPITVFGNTAVDTGASQLAGALITNTLTMPSGSLNVAPTGALTLAGLGSSTIGAATLTNQGTLRMAAAENLLLNDGAILTNIGTLDIQTDAGIEHAAGAVPTFSNAGTLRKSGGAGTSVVGLTGPVDFINSGVIDTQSGTIQLAANNTFNSGTQFIGPNLVTSNSTFNGTITSDALTLQSGMFLGNALFAGTTTWAGGTISGSFTVPSGATLNVAGIGTKTLDGAAAVLSNAGTLAISGSGDVLVSGGALLENLGILNLSGPGHIVLDAGPSRLINRATGTMNDLSSSPTPISAAPVTAAVFNNQGTFNKGADSAAVQTLDAPFNNTGVVNVDTGTLNLSRDGTDSGVYGLPAGSTLEVSGGTRAVDAGIAFTGPGTIRLSGGALDVRSGNLPRLDMTGGVLSRTTSGDVAIDGAFNVSGGTIFLAPLGQLVTNGTTTVTNTVNPISSWRNVGTIELNAGQISPSPGSGFMLTNQGTLNINTLDAKPFGDASGSQIVNSGVINKNAPVASDFANAFTNLASGTLNVNTDTLTLPLAVTQSGTIRINPGATLATGGNALTNLVGGKIGGSGTIDLGAATLTNAGTLQPGGSVANAMGTGTLGIVGNLAQAPTGAVDVQLAGTAPGTFSALSVSGNAALGGTLNLSTLGGYTPAIGDTFDVLTAASRSGTFALTTKTFANEVIPTYTPTGLSLLAGSVTGNTWILDAGDLWTNAAAWSQGHVPLATEQVVIDRPVGLFTVTLPAGAVFSVDSLSSNENINVAGTLGLASASTINGTLGVSGTVQGAGPVNVNGALSLTGGTIANTGGITVSGTTSVDTTAAQISSKLTTTGLNVASGSLAIAAGGALTLSGAGTRSIAGTLTNAGAVTLGGSGDLVLANGAQVTNSGAFVLASDAGVQSAAGAAANFTNTGTLSKTGGADSIIAIAAPGAFTNSGTLDAQAGRITFAGNNVFNGGTAFAGTGANVVTGNSIFNGAITSTNLTLQSGDFGGAANFSGAQTWTGGRMTGAFTVNSGATLDITGGAAKTYDAATASLANAGTINVGTAHAIDAPFSNAGSVNVNAGALTLTGNGTDTGAYAMGATTTLDVAGGTRNLNAGIALSGAGTLRLSGGTLNANTPVIQAAGGPALQFAGGVLNNTSGVTVNGPFTWSGGTLTGGGTFTTAAGTNTSVSGTANLVDTTWNNAGTIDLSGPGSIVLTGGGVVTTTFTNAAGGVINDSSASAAPVTTGATTRLNKSFVNAGTFNKLAGSAVSQTLDAPLTNTGTLDVQGGTLVVNGLPVNDGRLIIAAGATLATGGAALANAAGSLLQGNGVLDVGGATFTNSGTVAPGSTPGALTIAGNFTQTPAGSLQIELGGTTQGATYDLLRVTGVASLGGTLDLTLVPGFVPLPGSTFDFMTYAASIGDLGIVRTPALAALQVTPGVASYSAIAAAVPQNSTIFAESVQTLLVLNDQSLLFVMPQATTQDETNWARQECR